MASSSEGAVVIRLLPRSDYRRMRWQNGLGWTTEIAVHPGNPPDRGPFDWRVSIAEVDADCEFSRFPGIDRSLLVLTGDGLRLRFGDRPEIVVRPGAPFEFSGDDPAQCQLVAGPTTDFNVMTKRGAFVHSLTTRRLAGELALEAGRTWLVHVLAGSVELDGILIESGDSALAEQLSESPVVRGDAEIVLVELRRA